MAKSDPNLLTQAEYARSRERRGLPGATREAVRKAVKEQRISVFGPDKLVDQELADAQWERNTRARMSPQAAASGAPATPPAAGDLVAQAAADPGTAPPPPTATPAPDTGYSGARARREMADAEKAELETAKLRGSMVMREDVDRAIFEIARELRDRLTTSARRIAAEVASLATAEACEEVIDREHRIVLELLSSSSREKLGAPPKAATP